MLSEQDEIIEKLGVSPVFSPEAEIIKRASFLEDYLRGSACRTYVLGISGGVDSLTAGLLAQRAVSRLRESGYPAEFIAVRLPYGDQADEDDARQSVETIRPDRLVTINIRAATDAMMAAAMHEGSDILSGERHHFHLGNIKARQRMIAQYALAGAARGLVIGTDHAAEALMGFYTKFGDGAADLLPLSGLTKRRVRAIAQHLGAPDHLVFKIPTADLESDVPLRPDGEAYGVTYDEIDDFLEGKEISSASRERILSLYGASEHKRALPAAPLP